MLTLLIAAVMLAALPISGEEEIYDDVIRLHVLARSDSPEDQSRKLLVRDEILAVYGERLSGASTREEAEAMIDSALLDEIGRTAEAVLDGEEVEVFFSTEQYPTREYEGFRLPAGEYLSLRIVIGAGQGQNWWCVLYPPLCTATSLEGASLGLSDSEYALITSRRLSIRFKTLELLASLF